MQLKVTSESLQQTANNLARARAEVDAQLTTIKSQVLAVSADWNGSANTQFTALMERWQQASRDLNETLEGVHQALTASALRYVEVEQGITRVFAGG